MKKTIYIILFAILGLIFSIILHELIESIYLNMLDRDGLLPDWNIYFGSLCALPLWLYIGLPVLCILIGIRLGFIGWRIVYIEKRHWQWKNK